MKRFILFLLLLFINAFQLFAQTTLSKGDIMVIGVQADANCFSNNLINSKIYLVSLVDIEINTTIDITDNGFERQYTNLFGTTEGVLRFKRTGTRINAGTIFEFNFVNAPTGNINNTYKNTYADRLNQNNNGWNVSALYGGENSEGTMEFNINSSNDQFFILQGGNFTANGQHKGNYTGRFLYGFNSKPTWIRTPSSNGSTESALPGYDLEDGSNNGRNLRSYHLTPKTGGTTNTYYNGIRTPTSKNEWIIRLLNPNNWLKISNSDCNNFNINLNKLEIIQQLNGFEVCQDDNLQIEIEYDTDNPTNSIQTRFLWFSRFNAGNNGGNPTSINTRLISINTNDILATGIIFYFSRITYQLEWLENNNLSNSSSNTLPSGYYKITINKKPIISPIVPN